MGCAPRDAPSEQRFEITGLPLEVHTNRLARIYGVNPDRSLAGLPSSMTIRYTEEAHGENQAPGRAHPCRDRTQVPLCQWQLTVRFKDMTEEESVPHWRRIDGHNQLPKLIHGVRFTVGIEVIGNSAAPQAQAAA